MASVLLIDDDEITLSLLRGVLQEAGYEVYTTADGPQGLVICRQRKPDLVLLDLGLPSMNGLEVLRRLRAQDSEVKVVVLTGLGTSEALQVASGYGVSEFLVKPVEIESFMKKLRRALEDTK
jgi:DNA-binding response OmpR family regulator